MYYKSFININGLDLVVEMKNVETLNKRYRRLLGYFYLLTLSRNGINLDDRKRRALHFMINNFTEKYSSVLLKKYVPKLMNENISENGYYEINTYDENEIEDKIAQVSEVDNSKDLANSINEVLEAIMDDDFENEDCIEVNGNKFVYNKTNINPSDYERELYDIGNRSSGDTMYVYLNNDGELVIY